MDDQAQGVSDPVEEARLAALYRLHVLDTGRDPRFDGIVRTAALILRAPLAAIALIDRDRLWYKARLGFEDVESPKRHALGDFQARQKRTQLFADTGADPRLAPAVGRLDHIGIRFLGVAPLITPDGHTVGTLSVLDREPHTDHTEVERQALEDLAGLTMNLMLHDAATFEANRRATDYQQRLELALEAAKLGEFEFEISSLELQLSERFRRLVGVTYDVAPPVGGRVFIDFIHPEDREPVRERVRTSLETEGRFSGDFRLNTPEGAQTRWVHCEALVVSKEGEGARKVIGFIDDITERRAAEEHRELLLNELDHRVKNTLSAVQALASQTARRTTSVEGFLSTFAGRLKAMASAHDLLTTTRWRGASLADVVAAELGGLAPGQTRLQGPDILLSQHAANIVSLALHELATNAVKYGALSVESGLVEVIWKPRRGGGFSLRWTEMGGPRVGPVTRRGFGAGLLERITSRELGGASRVEYRPEGVFAVLEADGSALAVQDEAAAEQPPGPAPSERPVPAGECAVDASRIKGQRILIVEDAVLLALELEAGLADAGAVIAGNAASRDEAMAMLDRQIDAAVLDANLNGEMITPVAEALRARGTPFIFATGYGERGAPEGFNAPVVRKPYNVQQIIRALVEATSARG